MEGFLGYNILSYCAISILKPSVKFITRKSSAGANLIVLSHLPPGYLYSKTYILIEPPQSSSLGWAVVLSAVQRRAVLLNERPLVIFTVDHPLNLTIASLTAIGLYF